MAASFDCHPRYALTTPSINKRKMKQGKTAMDVTLPADLRALALRGRVHQQHQARRLHGGGGLQCRRGIAAFGAGNHDRAGLDRLRRGLCGRARRRNDRSVAGRPDRTSMTWTGSKLELVFNFNTIQILNRFRIELAGYQGLVIEEFSSSPDGVIREDLLADLQPSSQSLDRSSGKFSGDWIADFDPRHCKQVRLIVSDRVGVSISLRNIQFSQRTVSPSGQVQSLQITQPLGTVVFRAAQHTADQLTAIAHQVSTDNIHYLSVAAKKGTKMAAKWSLTRRAVRSEPFPLLRSVVKNGPEPSRARRCWARRSEPLTARTVLR